MVKNLNYDNSFLLTLFAIFVIFINIVSSIYFYTITFAGVIFVLFSKYITQQNLYLISLFILTFLFIETNQGFKLFTLTIYSMFIYIFIRDKIINLLSFSGAYYFLSFLIFYIGFYLLWGFFNSFELKLFFIFILNFIIDILFLVIL